MADNKNSTLPDIGDNTKEVAQSLIEALGVDPCLLSIIAVFVISLLIIMANNRHQQKMEEIRMKQFKELNGG